MGNSLLDYLHRVTTYTHYYSWGNNEKRATLKGRKMRVIARGTMNSALVEFENGQREIISRNAIRKLKNAGQ